MTRVTVKTVEPIVGNADVAILTANTITVENGLIIIKQMSENPLLEDFRTPTEEIVGIFRCEDVRCIYRTVSAGGSKA